MGEQIRQEDIKAGFENGILRLQVPKDAPKVEEDVYKRQVHGTFSWKKLDRWFFNLYEKESIGRTPLNKINHL